MQDSPHVRAHMTV